MSEDRLAGSSIATQLPELPAAIPVPLVANSVQGQALLSLVNGSAGLSGVTYDGSNKVTGFVAGGVTYTVAYASGSITVTGSDGSSVVVSLDGSGRISGVVAE